MKKFINSLFCFCLLLITNHVIAAGDPAAGKSKAILCIGCHGMDGNSSSTAFPKLAEQGEGYLAKQLHDFKTGERKEEHMTSMVEAIDIADIPDITAYFASQPRSANPSININSDLGKKIYHAGIKERSVVACASCHGAKGEGKSIANYPLLSRQHREYTAKALKDFRSGSRSNDPQKHMRNITKRLSDEEIHSLSIYIEILK